MNFVGRAAAFRYSRPRLVAPEGALEVDEAERQEPDDPREAGGGGLGDDRRAAVGRREDDLGAGGEKAAGENPVVDVGIEESGASVHGKVLQPWVVYPDDQSGPGKPEKKLDSCQTSAWLEIG